MCNDLDDGLFWCLVDRSDQLEEQRIALEAIIFRTGSSSEKPRYCLYNFYQKTWTTWSKYLLATPTFHILFEVESAETIPPELSLFILVNTDGSSHPMSFYSTLSRAPHSAFDRQGRVERALPCSKIGPVGLLTNHMGQGMLSIANASSLGRQPLLMFAA